MFGIFKKKQKEDSFKVGDWVVTDQNKTGKIVDLTIESNENGTYERAVIALGSKRITVLQKALTKPTTIKVQIQNQVTEVPNNSEKINYLSKHFKIRFK